MSSGSGDKPRRFTTRDLADRKPSGPKLVVVTAYDALFGRLVDEAGVDVVLVGDSLGNVVAGFDSTLQVTLDQMIYHATAVRRGVQRAMLVVDMPFLSYQVSVERALMNAGRIIQESCAQAVKLEGADSDVLLAVRAITKVGIPVMGHLGFTPQSVLAFGGHRVQGKSEAAANTILEGARALEEAGACAIFLELVPAGLAGDVTRSVSVPTIGIGAGPDCDGQVLVLPDLLGLNDKFHPKFLKQYASMADDVRAAVGRFGDDVRDGRYPDSEHSF